jgi:hypothetical protein
MYFPFGGTNQDITSRKNADADSLLRSFDALPKNYGADNRVWENPVKTNSAPSQALRAAGTAQEKFSPCGRRERWSQGGSAPDGSSQMVRRLAVAPATWQLAPAMHQPASLARVEKTVLQING